MKKIFTLLSLFLFVFNSSAQHVDYDNDSRWFLGLNVGGTWNTTDVNDKVYAGAGFILGKQFNYNYGRRTSFDLRFRYLGGNWYGQHYDTSNLVNYNPAYLPVEYDHYKTNNGFIYNNFRTRVHEIGLELAIHANGLRERTGWDPYIFGGVNFAWNQTTADLVNIDSSLFFSGYYDYTPDMSESAINSMLDGDYETAMNAGSELDGWNVNFVPSLGFGIGYQVGPRFSLGLEHKTSFALKNDWDGFESAEKKWGIFDNDIYHYSGGYLRFHFRGGANTNINNQNNNTNNLNNTPCPTPRISLVRPSTNNTTVDQQMYSFSARIENISAAENVILRLNGQATTNFFYNSSSQTIEANLLLVEGRNNIEIVATNGCGQDVESVSVNYETCSNPVINITQPAYSNTTNSEGRQVVRATISNNATVVTMSLNGQQTTNFFYNQSNGSLESNLSLQEGTNTITIVATNECGTDTETITVNYQNCKEPVVVFGTASGTTVNTSSFNYAAEVMNVASKNDIVVRLNGTNQSFTFNTSTKHLAGVASLRQGANTIEIIASNACGVHTQSITVNYEVPCVQPTVTMVSPVGNSQTQTGTQVVKATVTEVSSVSQIQLLLNGVQVSGGSYNAATKVFTHTISLQEGANNIQVIATNNCGSATQNAIVNKSTCQLPSISMVNPSAVTTATESASLGLQATLTGVTSTSQVVLTLNGNNVSSGATLSNGLYRRSLTLISGQNVITITATNSCGSVSETVYVNYNPCLVPVISAITPANGTQTNSASAQVSATVTNVQAANNIQVLVNGHVQNGGTYNPSTKKFTQTVALQEGQSTIQIIASSSCGNDQETIVITYNAPCDLPVINLTTPTSTTVTTDQGSMVIQASITGVTATGVSLTVNGTTQAGANFNVQSGIFNQRVVFVAGSNQIVITATNSCGTVSETIYVNYAPCQAPSIANVSPVTGTTTSSASAQVSATLTNLPVGSGVQVLVNGSIQNGGTYNASTGQFTQIVSLQEGQNTIQLVATSSCGSDQKSIVITYNAPCDPPVISMISPTSTTVNTDQGSMQIQATITGVSNNGITITVNGGAQSGMSYNAQTGLLSQRVTFRNGSNVVVITATNSCGTVTHTFTVNYNPCVAPTVSISAPINNYSTEQTSVQVQATVMNAIASQISMTVNGVAVAGGTYNATTKQYSNTANLNVGNNTIIISVATTCGDDSKSITVVRKEPESQTVEMITICHRPPGNPENTQELTIPLSAWPAHQAHGDVLGPCPVQEEEEEEESNQDQIGGSGNPREMITICHRPPGNPENTQELTIPLSAWPAHQAHGDVLGPCPVQEEEEEEESNQDQIGGSGNPREMITICHRPPGNPENTQELTIPLSAWPAHQAHGDVLGPCPSGNDSNNGSSGGSNSGSNNQGSSSSSSSGQTSNENQVGGAGPIRPGSGGSNTNNEEEEEESSSGSSGSTETNSNSTNEEEQNQNNINTPVPVRPRGGSESGEEEGSGGINRTRETPPRPGSPSGRP